MKKSNNGGFRWLCSQFRSKLSSLTFLIGANVLGAYLGTVFAVAIQEVIDSATGGNIERMIRRCFILAAIIMIRVLCNGLSIHFNEMIRADLDRSMKKNIMRKILHSEFSEISRYHSGDLVNRMNGDVFNVYNGVLIVLSSCPGLITSLVAAIIILWALHLASLLPLYASAP